MTRSGTWLASAAVVALTLGVTSRADLPTERERPLPPGSMIVAAEDAAGIGQTEESAGDSAKMGEDEGTKEGAELGETPKTETDKIDQPAREDKTAGETSGQSDSTPH